MLQLAVRLKLVAVTGAANVTGYMPDIYRLARKAHAAGAQILIDGAPHRKINMGQLNDPSHLDYLTISAHQMYDPFGTGALIGRRDTFEQGVPEYCGGGAISVVTFSEPGNDKEANSERPRPSRLQEEIAALRGSPQHRAKFEYLTEQVCFAGLRKTGKVCWMKASVFGCRPVRPPALICSEKGMLKCWKCGSKGSATAR
jgi:hypothetical protein